MINKFEIHIKSKYILYIMTTLIQNMNILSQEPYIYTIDNFVSPEQCQHLIDLGIPKLENSVVSDANGGYVSAGRTSKTSWIGHYVDDITTIISNKISEQVNIPIVNAEKFQLVSYDETNEYKSHYDSWDHNGSEKTMRCVKYGGPRVLTALLYLNNVEDGGHTAFTKLNINVEPSQGKLLVFENVYKNSIDKHLLTEHAGKPVIKGKKYIANLWFRQYDRTKLYSHFNPGYYKNNQEGPEWGENIDTVSLNSNNVLTNDVKISTDDIDTNLTLLRFNPNKDIFKCDNAFSNDECQKIINSVVKFSDKKYPSSWIKNAEHTEFINKLKTLCNLDLDFLENMNVVKYHGRQIHGPFYDAYDITNESSRINMGKLGQRLQTITIFLSANIKYEFNKLNNSFLSNVGSVLFYKNIENTRQRDDKLHHKIYNLNDNEGYLVNIYVRERNRKGNSNPLYNLETVNHELINNKDLGVKVSDVKVEELEDHNDTFNAVLNMFGNDKVTRGWNGYKKFNYAFKGDFSYFSQCIKKFKNLKDSEKGLLRQHLDKEYQFDEFNPVIVDDVLNNDMNDLLKEYYRTTINNNVFVLGDKQSQRFKAHNEPMSRFVQYEILPLIEKITGKRLKPTYTYLSSYIKDSDLPAHTDRPECEYTVSFLVNKDVDWPIYCHKVKQPIKNKGRYDFTPTKDECLSLDCDSNGFIIFSGTDHIHYREKFTGEFYDIILLHYMVDE